MGEARARRLLTLLAAIEEDLGAASSSVKELERLDAVQDDGLRAAAAATHLLRFYSAVEQAFERIAEEFNGGAPSGPEWHRELLRLMSRDVPEVRPAVVSAETVMWLDEYRKFRHRVLRAYGSPLIWEKMAHLVRQMPEGFQRLRADVDRFSSFVRRLAGSSGQA